MVRSNVTAGHARIADAPPGTIKRITSLTASRDIATVQQAIKDKYGFDVTEKYASDLIAFVEALTDGQ